MIDITESGVSGAEALLREVQARGLDPRPALMQATGDIVAAEQRRFSALGRVKAGTARSKSQDSDPRVRANATKAGVATGELREYMTTMGPKAQPAKITKDELIIGVRDRHKLSVRAKALVRSGHDPLVSRTVALRLLSKALTDHLMGRRR